MNIKKTKAELMEELTTAHQRIAELERVSIQPGGEALFSRVFQASPSLMALTEIVTGKYVEVNEAFLNTLGFTREEVIGKTANELNIFVDPTQRNTLFERLQHQGYLRDEFVLVRTKAGEIRYGLFTGEFVHIQEQRFVFTAMNDVTSREKVRHELKETHDRLLEAQKLAHIGNWEWTAPGRELFCSDELFNILQIPNVGNAVSPLTIRSMVLSEDKDQLEQWDRNAFASRSDLNYEFRIRLADGRVRWLHQQAKVTYRDDGQPIRMVGTIQDITEHKETELALQKSMQILNESQAIANLGSWTADLQTGIFDATPEGARLVGWTPGLHSADELMDVIHPDDREYMQSSWAAAMRGAPYDIEHRIILNGKIRWLHITAKITFDQNGTPVSAVGVTQDITDRRQAEDELHLTERRYRALIENAPDGIVLIGKDLKFKYVSPSAEKLFGYNLNVDGELSPTELTHPEDLPMVLGVLSDFLEHPEQTPTIQYRFLHKNGDWRWIESTFSNLLALPSVEAIVINFRDITERKQTEMALKASEENYRRLAETSDSAIAVLDRDGRILYANPIGLHVWNEPQLVGKTIHDLFPEEVANGYLDVVRRVINEQSTDTTELEVEIKGRLMWFHANLSPLKNSDGSADALLLNAMDITERKLAEDSLEKSEHVLRLFVEHSPASIAMFDRDMKYIVASRRYLKDYRLGDQDLTGRSHYEVFPEINDDLKQIHQRCLKGAIERDDATPFPRMDGTIDWVRWEVHPWYEESGTIGGIILFSEVITERIVAQEQLHESEEKYRVLINSTSDGVFVAQDERFVFCNQALPAMLGYSMDEFSDMPFEKVIVPEHLSLWTRRFRERIAGENIVSNYQVQLLDKTSAKKIWIELRANLINYRGQPAVLGIARDITDQKQILEQIESIAKFPAENPGPILRIALNGKLLYVNEASLALLTEWSLEIGKQAPDVVLKVAAIVLETQRDKTIETVHNDRVITLDFILLQKGGYINVYGKDITKQRQAENDVRALQEFSQSTIDALSAHLCVLDETGMILSVNAAWRAFSDANPPGLSNYGVGENYLAVCDNAEGEQADDAHQVAIGLRAVLNGETDSYHHEYSYHSPKEKRWFFLRAQRFESHGVPRLVVSHENITDRKKASEALRHNELKYRSLYENLRDGFAGIAFDGTILEYNEAFRSMLGYSDAELKTKTFMDVTPEKWHAFEDEILKTQVLTRGYSDVYEKEYRNKDGVIFPVEIRAHLTRDEVGRPAGMWAMVRDITYRKAIERELIRINKRFTELAEHVSDIFWISEPQANKHLYVSPAFTTIMGRSKEEVAQLPNGYLDIVLPEDQPILIRKHELEDSGFKTNVQYRISRPDASIRWIRDKGTPVFDNQGKVIRVVGIASDITEQVETAARISESEKRFQQIAETIPEMFWMFDNVKQNLTYVSPAYEMIWGRPVQELYENGNAYLDGILPEDHNVVFTALEKQANGEESEMEYRVLQPDGSIRWVHDRSFPIFDEKTGSLIRTAGVATDVTERKRTEAALRESEERLRISISAAKQGLYDLNMQTGETIVNREYAEMLGYDPDTFTETNQAWLERLHPDDQDITANVYKEYIQGLIPEYRVEFRQRTFDGKWKWILSLGKIVEYDADGKPLRMLGTHTDITERKQAELELQKRASHLTLINDVGRQITGFLDFQAVMDVFPRIVQEAFGYHHIGLFTLDKSSGQLMMSSKSGEYAGLFPQGHRIPLGEGVVGSVAMSGEMKLVNRVYDDPLYIPTVIPTQAELSLPIKIGGEVVGVLDVQSPQPDAFTDEDITVLGTLVDQMAVVIENARLYEAAQTELAERKRVEEERLKLIEDLAKSVKELTVLHESGRALSETLDLNRIYPLVYRYIAEVMPCDFLVISTFDPQTELITCEYLHSQEGPQDVSGFPPIPLEPPGRGTQSLVIRSGESLLLSDYDKAVNTATNKNHFNEKAEIVEMLPDDEERTRSAIIVPLKVNGVVMGVLQVFNPHLNAYTSNHLHFVEALAFHLSAALSNARLFSELEKRVQQRTAEVQDLYENAPTGYHSLNNEGQFINVNQTELNWLGYTREEMIGRTFSDFITPETTHIFVENFPVFKKRGWVNNLEFDLLRKDGTSFPVLINATAVKNEAGDFLMSRSTVFDNTERKQAELALREREENYRALFQSANDAIFMLSPEGVILRANPRCMDLLGYTPDELIGRMSYEFIAYSERDDADNILTRLLAGERLPVYYRNFVRKDGSLVDTEVNLSLIRDESGAPKFIQSVVRDISARKQAENALRESEEQNRLLFEDSPDAVVLFDQLGRVVRINHAFETITGRRGDQFIGHLLTEIGILPRQLIEALSVSAQDALEQDGKIAVLEFKMEHVSGEMRDISARIFTLNLHGEPHYLASIHDVTTSKRAEETLRLANTEMERALRLKDEFLANMSHELRTPLNAVLGITESLLEQISGPLNEKQQKYLQTVSESAQHLLELINDILDLAKINAGRIDLDINKADIVSVANASLRMVRELAQKKGVATGLKIDSGIKLAWVDERRLKQMLVNLLSNAVKFTPHGGNIGLEVRGDAPASILYFTVWDTGIGINPQDLRSLFQPFVQLDAGLARGNQGTGLGLVLVSQMARLHGGSVTVESEPGKGSRFTISLPWVVAGGSDMLVRREHPAIKQNISAIRKKEGSPIILIVEDTEAVTMLISDYLKQHGYQVMVARDGYEGIARSAETRPDLILMDVMMPELDGFETTRRIRNNPELADVPIIALTALAMAGDRERCIAAGMNDYLSKPVKLKELLDAIEHHLEAPSGGTQ